MALPQQVGKGGDFLLNFFWVEHPRLTFGTLWRPVELGGQGDDFSNSFRLQVGKVQCHIAAHTVAKDVHRFEAIFVQKGKHFQCKMLNTKAFGEWRSTMTGEIQGKNLDPFEPLAERLHH
jgi:hypothetical protein